MKDCIAVEKENTKNPVFDAARNVYSRLDDRLMASRIFFKCLLVCSWKKKKNGSSQVISDVSSITRQFYCVIVGRMTLVSMIYFITRAKAEEFFNNNNNNKNKKKIWEKKEIGYKKWPTVIVWLRSRRHVLCRF